MPNTQFAKLLGTIVSPMKKLLILFLLISNNGYGQSQNLYKSTIDHIKGSKEFSKFIEGGTRELQVMPSVIPFTLIGFGFFDKIQQYTGIDYSNGQNIGETMNNPELCELSDKKKSKLKIFFSPIENGLMIAEVVYSRSKNDHSFKNITNFGLSLIYLAKYQDGELVELIAKEINSN